MSQVDSNSANIFSVSGVQSGAFTKFIAMTTLCIATLIGLSLLGYQAFNPAYHAPDIVTYLVPSGLTYFVKAAGVADGATLASNAMATQPLPPVK